MRLCPRSTLFDCDKCVHELLTTPLIVARITEVFGDEFLDTGGRIDRAKLGGHVFTDSSGRAALEGILHPEVRRLCHSARDKALKSDDYRLFIADVPLFFENGFPLDHDSTLVVATTRATQLQRLLKRSRIEPELAEAIIDAQLPISSKISPADVVIWNGGGISSLTRQIELFLRWMQPLSI